MNTDSSSLGTPRAAGAGGIFRTSVDFPHGAFAFNMGNLYTHIAELSVAICSIEVAWEK